MERRKKIEYPPGRIVEAAEVTFQAGGEHWNEYLLDDGSVIRLKTVTTEILRVDGEYDKDGNPMYVVKSANIVVVSSPDKLRRQGGA